MYNTSIICTYNTPEVFVETDEVSNDERQFIRDVIYRQEILNIFGLEEYNKELFDDKITELYDKIINNDDLNLCMLELASHLHSKDKKLGLLLLISYDFMHLAHKCICEFLNTNHISEENLYNLKTLITSNIIKGNISFN